MKNITKLILFVVLPIIVLVLLAVFAYPAYQRHCIIQEAYDQGILSIDAEAKSIRQWVLSGKNGTAKAADELSGWGAKWKYIYYSKEEFHDYVESVVSNNTHSLKQYNQRMKEGVEGCMWDIHNIEIALADKLSKEYSLSEAQTKGINSKIVSNTPNVAPNVVAVLAGDIISLVIAGVTEKLCVTSVIVGTGTVASWATLGASIVVGIIVDAIIGWFIDSEGSIKDKIDESIDTMANESEDKFREKMKKVLDERRTQWEKVF